MSISQGVLDAVANEIQDVKALVLISVFKTVSFEQEQISPNHAQALFLSSAPLLTIFYGLICCPSRVQYPFCLRWETSLRQLQLRKWWIWYRPFTSRPATFLATAAVSKTGRSVHVVSWAWARCFPNI